MLLRELRDVGEFYLAYRILGIATTCVAGLCVLIFPPWVIGWFLVGAVGLIVVMIPLILVWAVAVFVNGLRRM